MAAIGRPERTRPKPERPEGPEVNSKEPIT